MNAIEALHPLSGSWGGESRLCLHRPDEATYDSVMTATIEPAMQRQALLVRYAWEIEGEPQEGLLVLNQLAGIVAGVWFDRWTIFADHPDLQPAEALAPVISALAS